MFLPEAIPVARFCLTLIDISYNPDFSTSKFQNIESPAIPQLFPPIVFSFIFVGLLFGDVAGSVLFSGYNVGDVVKLLLSPSLWIFHEPTFSYPLLLY